MRKLIFQSPCGFGRLDLAAHALAVAEYAKAIDADFTLFQDRQPRVLAPAWSQAFAMLDAIRETKYGDVVCWLAPDARVVTDEDIFSVLKGEDWLRSSFYDGRPHPRSIWIRNSEPAERFVRRVVYHARKGRDFVNEFSQAASAALPAPAEWVGALALWAADPDLPPPRVVAAVGANDATELEPMFAILPAAIEAHRCGPRAAKVVPEDAPKRRVAPPAAVVERPGTRMRRYGPKS